MCTVRFFFPDREGSSPAEKLPEVQAESKFPREPHTGRMEDLVGYDVSSLVTWVKSLIVNVKIASRSFHFSHKEFGWYRGYKIRPNGVNLYARFFVTIQSQWRSSLNEQRTGKPVLQVSIADAILRMRLWIVTIWKYNTHPGTSKNTCATRHSVQNSTVCRIAHRNEE